MSNCKIAFVKLDDEEVRDVVRRYYDEASVERNGAAAEAFLDGLFFGLRAGGSNGDYEKYLNGLEERIHDLLDSFVEGEWE